MKPTGRKPPHLGGKALLTLSHLFVGKASVEKLNAADGLPGPNLKPQL